MTRTYFHASLEFDRHKGGYYYSDDAFEFTLNDISAEAVWKKVIRSLQENVIVDFEYSGRWNTKAARPYVKERLWADNQKLTDFEDDEKTRIDFSSTQVLKVMEWILAQGANVVPQSPQWFVDDWKKIVKAMMKRVKSDINN